MISPRGSKQFLKKDFPENSRHSKLCMSVGCLFSMLVFSKFVLPSGNFGAGVFRLP